MESSENNRFNSMINSGPPAPANSRWNPTKEQIRMLENLYRLGIRTPNADQIQKITSRLRAFGQIEGKNVFYWFQNHKARQKQKQKQECLAHFHRFLHNRATTLHRHHHQSPAVFPPPPCPNVVCSPYYLPQSELGFCPQYPKLIFSMGGFRRRSRSEKIDSPKANACAVYEPTLHKENNSINYKSKQETLPLFPLHPTGILQGREKPVHSLGSSSTSTTKSISVCDKTAPRNYGLGYADKPFFNFFSRQGACESD